jgi:hypothetical protein
MKLLIQFQKCIDSIAIIFDVAHYAVIDLHLFFQNKNFIRIGRTAPDITIVIEINYLPVELLTYFDRISSVLNEDHTDLRDICTRMNENTHIAQFFILHKSSIYEFSSERFFVCLSPSCLLPYFFLENGCTN